MADIQKLKKLIADWESTSDDIPFGLDEDDRVILEAMKFAADNHDIVARLEAAEAHAKEGWRVAYEVGAECDQLKAQAAELAKQKPYAYSSEFNDISTEGKNFSASIFNNSWGDYTKPLYTRAAPLTLPDAIDGSRVAHVYLDTMAADKLDAYVMGANDMLAKVKRLNGLEEKHDK